MKSRRQKASIKTMQKSKMFDDSPNYHDELDQMFPCETTTTRLLRPMQRRVNNQTMFDSNHRKTENRMVSSKMKSTRITTTISIPRAILKRQTNSSNTIESSITTTTNKMCYNFNRQPNILSQTRRATVLNSSPFLARNLLNYLIVTLVLSSCLFINHIGAYESVPSETSPVQSQQPKQQETGNKVAIERSDSMSRPSETVASSSSSSSSSSSQSSSQKSIVASLSSAVATAAAAAAVAAAQNGLSNNDARSLTSSSSHRQHAQQHAHRSPGLNLAIKLVDTIPEVPYNILHNMKKVDHAAPFYNTPNKFSGGAPKESTQNFLANALTATGAAEQLSVLFKSPLWKRIADGYGDFASEFRSMFRAPGATPMKGPSSSTSKLLRDISVPALLMLLASSISGELRPVRTRRKSFRPVDIPASAALHQKNPLVGGGSLASILDEPSALPASSSFSSSSSEFNEQPVQATQYFQRYEQNQRQPQSQESLSSAQTSPVASYLPAPSNEWLQQQHQLNAANQLNFARQQQASQIGQLSRIRNDINLRSMDSQTANWISPDHVVANAGGLSSFMPNGVGGNDQQQLQAIDLQGAPATFGNNGQQQAVVRRSGEFLGGTENQQHLNGNQAGQQFYKFGSLASALIASSSDQRSKLISKLFNANVANDGNSYSMMGLLADHDGSRVSSIKRRDQLSDEHRYSLVDSDEINSNSATSFGDGHEQQSASATKQQPLLLSSMAHAVASMLNSRPVSGKSGSPSKGAASSPVFPLASLMSSASNKPQLSTRSSLIQNLMIGDETSPILMRRHPQAEQRDLTKLLPETWREVVKRTMTTVQQQANTQWKSIEGQLANWVQDKLKTVAASASNSPNLASSGSSGSSSASSHSSGSSSSASAVPAPIGNMLASVSSTALNILGLHKNNNTASPSNSASLSQAAASAQVSQAKSQPKGDEPTVSANQRGKIESTKLAQSQQQQQPSIPKGALAGVANLIVSSISQRNSHSQSSSPMSTSSSQHQPPPTNDKQKSQPLGEIAVSVASAAMSSIASKYPTLTGITASSHSSPLVPTSHQSASAPQETAATIATTNKPTHSS